MNYKDISKEDWYDLSKLTDPSKFEGILINDPNGNQLIPIYLFSQNKEYHLLIKNIDKIESFEDPQVNGVELLSKSYFINEVEEDYIDLRLKNEIYLDQFTIIISEICEKIFEQKQPINEAIYDTLMRWKTFWSSIPREELSEEKQLGLFCELKFLLILIENGKINNLNAWKGPSGFKYDFLLEDKAFEIKGTFKNNHSHSINGIDQLNSSENSLYLISFLASKDENSSENLQSIVESIEQIFSSNPKIFENFHKLLKKAGYNKIHSEKYMKLGIKIIEQNCYAVNDSFPKLISSFLNQQLSDRVSNIKYSIQLDGIKTVTLLDII